MRRVSALSQVMVVPAFTVMRSGEKAKLSISTLVSGAGAEITGKLMAAPQGCRPQTGRQGR
jgi:hypothetical protein